MEHSHLGASGAHRWMVCPGSIRLTRGIPKTSSVYADEGTAAHWIAEQSLRTGREPSFYLGLDVDVRGTKFEVTEELVKAIELYVATIKTDMPKGAILKVEQRFDLDWLHPGMFGTNDASVGQPFGVLRIYDLKYGAGYPVEVAHNPQLKYYGLGGMYGEDYERVETVIVQPRARHSEGPVRRWSYTPDELLRWAKEELLPAALATEQPNAPLVPGDHCRFCDAAGRCPALAEKALVSAQLDFAPEKAEDLLAPELMDAERLGEILTAAPLFESWIKSCYAHAQQMLERGEDVPGFKLVVKKAHRKWADPAEVINRLFDMGIGLDHIYDAKPKTPAAMAKMLKETLPGVDADGVLGDLIINSNEGAVTIAPEYDKRKAVGRVAATDFLTDDPMFN